MRAKRCQRIDRLRIGMGHNDQRLPIDRRSKFRRLTDRLVKKRADFAQVRIGVAFAGGELSVFRLAAAIGVMNVTNVP